MIIVKSELQPPTKKNQLAFPVPDFAMSSVNAQLQDKYWVIITLNDLINASQIEKKIYKTTQQFGYSLFGNQPPLIDKNSFYYIKNFAKSFDNRPIIARVDGNTYHGNNCWIVDQYTLLEVTNYSSANSISLRS